MTRRDPPISRPRAGVAGDADRKRDGHRPLEKFRQEAMRSEPAIARLTSPSRNTPSVGCMHGVGRSPGLRSGMSPFDPAFPTRSRGSGLWASLRSRSRGRLLFGLHPTVRARSHSLFACLEQEPTQAPFAQACRLSSRRAARGDVCISNETRGRRRAKDGRSVANLDRRLFHRDG